MAEHLTIIKVGGKVVEEPDTLARLLDDFSRIEGHKLLVHGGGRSATKMAARLGIETRMVDGRRITDDDMIDVVTMVYGGLVNKTIVAALQARGINALGVTGADMNLLLSDKRVPNPIDYGWVGDVRCVDGNRFAQLISSGIVPVVAPLTHDGLGHILNTNADTMASCVAKALAQYYEVTLIYTFEKKGVLSNPDDEDSVIPVITHADFAQLVKEGVISGGMIPKVENALAAIDEGVSKVIITLASAIDGKQGTIIK